MELSNVVNFLLPTDEKRPTDFREKLFMFNFPRIEETRR